jgi:hypothetical protein
MSSAPAMPSAPSSLRWIAESRRRGGHRSGTEAKTGETGRLQCKKS